MQDQVGYLFTEWAPMTLATGMLYPLVRAEFKTSPPKGTSGWKDAVLFLVLALIGGFPAQVLVTWGMQLSLASNDARQLLTAAVEGTEPVIKAMMVTE